MTQIVRDLQKQNPGGSLVILYELEMPDGTTWYFHDGKSAAIGDVTFGGNTYSAVPVEFDGIDDPDSVEAEMVTDEIAHEIERVVQGEWQSPVNSVTAWVQDATVVEDDA